MAQVIGIRREDKNEWERRAPLAPTHVRRLVAEGLRFVVQPSSNRIFPDAEYVASGASLSENLSGCGLVLGIKEIPSEEFIKGGVYLFFSHVTKGQPYNMGMLGRILGCQASLIDYEHVVDASGRRRLFFGNHAGAAGLFETLHALGQRLELEGHSNALSLVKRPLEFADLDEGRRLLANVGDQISRLGVGEGCAPIVVGFTGYGNVSIGAQSFFDELPHDEIAPEELGAFMAAGQFSDRTLYKVVFGERDMVVPIDGARIFDLEEYYAHPERYRGTFESHLPHLTVLINCIYWDRQYPRLVSKQWLRLASEQAVGLRLRVIGDITCDIEGSIECTIQATGPSQPTYTYLPRSETIVGGCAREGVVVMAVDTLPAEVPYEASLSFGDMLFGFVRDLEAADFTVPFQDLALPEILKRALIVYQGALTERYQYLVPYLESSAARGLGE